MKEKKVTMPEILKELSERYGICAERKSIYSDIESLRNFGFKIVGEKQGKTFTYFLSNSFHLETPIVNSTKKEKIGERGSQDSDVILDYMMELKGIA